MKREAAVTGSGCLGALVVVLLYLVMMAVVVGVATAVIVWVLQRYGVI